MNDNELLLLKTLYDWNKVKVTYNEFNSKEDTEKGIITLDFYIPLKESINN